MEKDRRRRYSSAAEFAADIEHYLENKPVLASPPSRLYRIRKFVSKHRWPVAAAAAILVALCVGFATSTFLYVKTARAWEEAVARALSREEETGRVLDQLKNRIRQNDFLRLQENNFFLRQENTLKLARLEQQLPRGRRARFYALASVAKAAFDAGDLEKAQRYARELLSLTPNYRDDPNYGDAVFFGNMIVGQVALRRENVSLAKSSLLASGLTPGSAQIEQLRAKHVLGQRFAVGWRAGYCVGILRPLQEFLEIPPRGVGGLDGRRERWRNAQFR